MGDALQKEERGRLPSKFRLAATAKDPMESDMRSKELAMARLNSISAFE